MHGCGKVEHEDGGNYWGDFKEHKNDGYGTFLYPDGDRYIG